MLVIRKKQLEVLEDVAARNFEMEDESITDPNEKAERLERKMKIYLDQALKNLEQNKK